MRTSKNVIVAGSMHTRIKGISPADAVLYSTDPPHKQNLQHKKGKLPEIILYTCSIFIVDPIPT